MSLFEPKLRTIEESKISNASENNSFSIYFMSLKLRRECKGEDMKVGESKAETGLRESYNHVLSRLWLYLRGLSLLAFQGCTRTMHRAGLKPFYQRSHRPTQLEMYDLSQHPLFHPQVCI